MNSATYLSGTQRPSFSTSIAPIWLAKVVCGKVEDKTLNLSPSVKLIPTYPLGFRPTVHKPKLILASTSKARQALLTNAGITFDSLPPLVNEKELRREMVSFPPQQIAVELAKAKAISVSLVHPRAFVIGADQILEFEHKPLHKAVSITEAKRKLKRLRGKAHHLYSSFACARKGQIIHSEVITATLTMRHFTDEFLTQYLEASGKDILSTVGCYFFEGQGIQLFQEVEGDHSTILGLPLLPLLAFLRHSAIIAS